MPLIELLAMLSWKGDRISHVERGHGHTTLPFLCSGPFGKGDVLVCTSGDHYVASEEGEKAIRWNRV